MIKPAEDIFGKKYFEHKGNKRSFAAEVGVMASGGAPVGNAGGVSSQALSGSNTACADSFLRMAFRIERRTDDNGKRECAKQKSRKSKDCRT